MQHTGFAISVYRHRRLSLPLDNLMANCMENHIIRHYIEDPQGSPDVRLFSHSGILRIISACSRDITSFIGTMGESDSSMVFARTHHCLGRYSLLAHVQNHPGLPGTLDITISGMPCSRTPVRFHSLALTTTPYWWPKEVPAPTQSITLTKLNHFTLSHYDVPVPCPTLKRHC